MTAELGLAYALAGNRGEALKLAGQLNEQSKQRYISPFNRAVIYGGLGDKRRAMEWLEKAYDERSVSLNLLKLSPAFISLRGDARFVPWSAAWEWKRSEAARGDSRPNALLSLPWTRRVGR